MRVKFTLIALTSVESSIHSGSRPPGFQARSAPCKPGSSVCREGRVGTGGPEQSLGPFRCGRTALGTHWGKWSSYFAWWQIWVLWEQSRCRGRPREVLGVLLWAGAGVEGENTEWAVLSILQEAAPADFMGTGRQAGTRGEWGQSARQLLHHQGRRFHLRRGPLPFFRWHFDRRLIQVSCWK